MKTNTSKIWVAAHIYQSDDYSRFVVRAIKPFIQKINQLVDAEHYFFIRYWEKGPHVRLRFKIEAKNEEYLRKELVQYFTQYFEQNPSKRSPQPDDRNLFPDNSIHFLPYEPETDRYGGEAALLVAEEIFYASSKTVLSKMEEEWTYELALGSAIQLHLGLAFACEMSNEEAIDFFEFVCQNWLSLASYPPGTKLISTEIQDLKEKTISSFEKSYEEQSEEIDAYIEEVWSQLHDSQHELDDRMKSWVLELKSAFGKLKTLKDEKRVFIKGKPVDYEKSALWPILDSYVHMTNNRLGLLNRDESFICFLLTKGLKKTIKSKEKPYDVIST